MKKLCILFLLMISIEASAQFANNKVIAHRGAWKTEKLPQNSMASFKHAVELGCAGSECDVYLTKDSVLVLNHDNDLQGFIVEKCTLAELQQKKLSNGETIALLDNILDELVKQHTTRLFLEIKPSVINQEYGFACVDKVLATVERHKAADWIVYISFDYSYLRRINEKNPNAKTAFLGSKLPLDTIIADKQFGIDYVYSMFKNDETLISRAKANNINVNVWTVNKEEDLKYFLDQGVDFITTNEPELLMKLEK